MTDITFEKLSNGILVAINRTVRFGRDSILLADFALSERIGSLLDLGCGCGILALSAADRGFHGSIVAIDKNALSCFLTSLAIAKSALAHVTVVHKDLRCYNAPRKFDAVLCNPPYFSANTGSLGDTPYRRKARHQGETTLEDFITAAARNLKQRGKFFLCYPAKQLAPLFSLLRHYRLEPKKLQLVRTSHDKEPWLALVEAKYFGGIGLRILPDIIDTV